MYCPIPQEVKATRHRNLSITNQLIEHKMRSVFLEKSCTKCNGEASPRLFNKKSKLSISLD